MPSRELSVDTRPTKAVVVSSLTRDASVEACIFDLIDNSIDAARVVLLGGKKREGPEDGLPASYKGIKIALNIDHNGVEITDNSDGISAEDLSNMVLRFGIRSKRKYGIGLYGVGLNRAIFKLGNITDLDSDDGTEKVTLSLNASDYLASDKWELPASATNSTAQRGTKIKISSPPMNVARFISNEEWVSKFKNEAGKRYFKFIDKGLELKINGKIIQPIFVPLRTASPFPARHKLYTADNGVEVYIEAGQHHRHRFSAELDFDRITNKEIAGEYGWSIICNDRLIVMSDTSDKTGWDKKWHPEFNGFVGYVWFSAEEGSNLPWNTAKTDVDVFDSVYQEALEDMREFTSEWRSFGRVAKNKKKRGEVLQSPEQKEPAVRPRGQDAKSSESAEQASPPQKGKGEAPHSAKSPQSVSPVTKLDHNQLRTVLPSDVDERHCKNKLLLLVHEAKAIDIYDATYSALALIRMLFETAAIEYMIRRNLSKEMREYCFQKFRKKPDEPSDDKILEKNYQPNLDGICDFILSHDEVWGDQKGPYIKQSAEKFKKHKGDLNAAVHWPLRTIGFPTALEIRNEVLPVLRHFIED